MAAAVADGDELTAVQTQRIDDDALQQQHLQLQQMTLTSHTLRKRGLREFDPYDPELEVETPRSIAACAKEGIRPQDLRHIPREAFQREGVQPEVADLRFRYFEALREDLLALAHGAYEEGDAGPQPSSPSRALPDAEYRNSIRFFREALHSVDLAAIPTREDWTTCPRTEEFKRVDMYASFRRSSSSLSPEASPKSAFMSTKDLSLSSSWWQMSAASWRSATSEDNLQSSIREITNAPGSDWREIEAARRAEDRFGILREMKNKDRDARHANDNHTIHKRTLALDDSLKKLEFDQAYKNRLREIREHMMPPRGAVLGKVKPKVFDEAQAAAQRNREMQMYKEEQYRRERLGQRADKFQAVERHLDEERNKYAMKFAQMNLEDRVRWRHNHSAVTHTKAEERQGILDDFKRKQGQLDAAGKRVSDMGFLKREIHGLRKAHRTFAEERRRRKEEFEEEVRRGRLKELAARRDEHTRQGVVDVPPMPQGASTAMASASKTFVERDEESRQKLSSAELQWMQRARSTAKGSSLKGLAGSASMPNLRT